mgnify:CR=1 FL=1
MPMLSTSNKLEEILVDKGVSELDIDKAKAYQNKYGGALELLLVNLGSLAEEELPQLYSQLLDIDLLDQVPGLESINQPEICHKYNIDFLLERDWAPYRFKDGTVFFATTEPLNWDARQYLEGEDLRYSLAVCNQDVLEQIKRAWQQNTTTSDDDAASILSDLEEDKLRELASEAPTVNLLNSLIAKGLKIGASDMHIEPVLGRCRVRYRVDGVLHDADTISKKFQLPVMSRLKILSGMDIAEKRRPQDGKIELKIANTELDIRVSALPLNEGESMVMRFLRKDSVTYDMSVIGLSDDIEAKLQEDLKSTAGVILLSGPTGSGKTTTLYTFLNALNNDDVKIITLEDPVEYQLEGINQVQVNSDIGFTFESGLRSIVRQDPDIIMLGEIRDKETARIAMQSALTGHLVFSTVHTNDAPSAFTRLLDLGVEEFLLNAAIVSIVAQRLARKLCVHCATPDPEQEMLIKKYRLDSLLAEEDILIKAPTGCTECGHTGYKGRTAIIEYLRCNESIKALNKDQTFIQNAKEINKRNGGRTLLEDGLLKVAQGITTIDEVIRVAG